MIRIFYGFVIVIVVLAGAVLYEPQSVNAYGSQGWVNARELSIVIRATQSWEDDFYYRLPSPLPETPRSRINARDRNGQTPLMRAASLGRIEAIRQLLNAGADIEARGNNGFTALMLAAGLGRIEAIRQLLNAGADIEARDNNDSTALMLTAGFGQLEAIRVLLNAGADIEARNNGGMTALMFAAAFGQPEAIQVLLKAGADKWARTNSGGTAFDLWQSQQKHHPNYWTISRLLRP